MPTLKTRNLFISHAWSYDSHYTKLVEWFDAEPNFDWKNYSVPNDNGCTQKTCLTNQMSPSSCVIILAGMWANHSGWIQYEIDEAIRMGKTIIGVYPWGQTKTPNIITDAAHEMVKWQSASIIKAIRDNV